jgi:hypothetical protein
VGKPATRFRRCRNHETPDRLAVPDEFDFAFVFEEKESVALRNRASLLDELDDVALLGVGEFVVGFAWDRLKKFTSGVALAFITSACCH